MSTELGVASRLRRIDGMKNEIENRKAAIVRFKGQLKKAKGKEKAKLLRLIAKYEARIKALREAIEEKEARKGGRERWWERAQTRATVFAGELGATLGSTFSSESGAWKPILILGGIGLLAWLAPKYGMKRKGGGNYGGVARSNPGPTAAQRQKLIETYAIYTHSTGVHHGPTRDKLYKQWEKAEDKVLKAAGVQYLSDENRAALDKAAKKWWDSRPFRGAGVDW